MFEYCVIWIALSIVVTGAFFGFAGRNYLDEIDKEPFVAFVASLATLAILIFWPVILLWLVGKWIGNVIEDRL